MTERKIHHAYIAILCLLLSCNSTVKDKIPPKAEKGLTQGDGGQVETICFEHTSGKDRRDTSVVRLDIQGKEVTGMYSWLPYQKDSRKGTIKGTLKDAVIRATWVFMQEGMTDSLPVEFKLTENKLLQKNYSVSSATGRQFISDTSKFSIEYSSSPCK